MVHFKSLADGIEYAKRRLINSSHVIHTEKWQGLYIMEQEAYKMREALNVSFSAIMPEEELSLIALKEQCLPNLPWADIHFDERISGLPLNPGESYKQWPFYGRDKEMRSDEKFSHTYMERFWPKKAWDEDTRPTNGKHLGIRYEYGDLLDLIGLLSREPYTRQAFLPVWFPEDTGSTHGGRVPCTLGYHFIRRGNHFHMVYYIRSCDFFRHFRDDIYLGVRLLYWILNNLEIKDQKGWRDVKPGIFTMHITSLHIFNNEYPKLLKP